MLIYDKYEPEQFPPCKKIQINFKNDKEIHFVSTRVTLETYIKSLIRLTDIKNYRGFTSLLIIETNNNEIVDLSDYNQISKIFNLNVSDILEITIKSEMYKFECPICLENKNEPLSPFNCEHFICGSCLTTLRRSDTCMQNCPLCRSS